MLLRGKGTALIKNLFDLRPVVTAHPILQYVGHALAIQYKADIRRVCGREQFMGAPAGCEIVAHLIRSQLEADPTLVVGKVDCKNAFNEIHKDPIIDVIRDEIPALLPFAHLMLTKSPIQTVYHDTRTKVTSVYIMRDGVQQCFLQPRTISLHPCSSTPRFPFSSSLTTLTFLVNLTMLLLPSTPFANSMLT
jgi:hypothetical protein